MFTLLEAAIFSEKLKKLFSDSGKPMPNLQSFSENMNKYLSIKTIVKIITGDCIYFSLHYWLRCAIMWGLITFLLNYIPNIGSIIASIPAILITLSQFKKYILCIDCRSSLFDSKYRYG